MNYEQDNPSIKIIFLGESGVGKTSLTMISTGQKFDPNTKSTVCAYFNEGKYESKNGKTYLFNLWDTAGQELYRAINKIYINDSKIVLIVYAINNNQSFQEIDYWINYVKSILKDGEYILALVGNKCDLYEYENTVPDEEAEKVAKKYNIKLKITSALTESKSFNLFLYELIDDYIKLIGPNAEKKYLDNKSMKINKRNHEKRDKKRYC